MEKYKDLDTIISVTASECGVTTDDIYSKCRLKDVVEARHIAMYLSRKMGKYILADIGRKFDRNHASILHGHNRVTWDMDLYPDVRSKVERIRRSVLREECSTPTLFMGVHYSMMPTFNKAI